MSEVWRCLRFILLSRLLAPALIWVADRLWDDGMPMSGFGRHCADGKAWLLRRLWLRGEGIVYLASDLAVTLPLQGNIEIGGETFVGKRCFFGNQASIRIGGGSALGNDCRLLTATHDPQTHAVRYLPVQIGAGCWLGAAVTVLPGVSIGAGSLIGAGAVVTRDIPPNSVAVGVPARVVRARRT